MFVKKIYGIGVGIVLMINSFGQCSVSIQPTNTTCCGNCDGYMTANPSGGTPPYTYSWSPNGCTMQTCSGLCAGTYTCTVTDANAGICTATAVISGPFSLNITVTDASCSFCCDGIATAVASGGQAPYSYLWQPNPFQTTQTATGLCVGTYTVCVTDVNGACCCTTVTVNFNTGTNGQPNSKIFVNISHNPNNGKFTISSVGLVIDCVEIYNVFGNKVYSVAVSDQSPVIDILSQPNGVYFVRVVSIDKKTFSAKLIKQ